MPVQVLAYDQRGHGGSGAATAGTATVEQLGDDLAELVGRVPGRVVLVGHGMGGLVVLALAVRHPVVLRERVGGLVLLATAAGGLAESSAALPSSVGRLVQDLHAILGSRIVSRVRSRLDKATTVGLRWLLLGEDPDGADVALVAEMVARHWPDVAALFRPALDRYDRRAALLAGRTCRCWRWWGSGIGWCRVRTRRRWRARCVRGRRGTWCRWRVSRRSRRGSWGWCTRWCGAVEPNGAVVRTVRCRDHPVINQRACAALRQTGGIQMPEFVNGLPLHALVVHGVVVLVPLAVLGAIVIAVWPWARRRIGWLVVGVAAVATALVPIATNSGEKLAGRLPENPLIEKHEELGELLVWFVLPLLVLVVALMLVDRAARVPVAVDGPGADTAARQAPAWTKIGLIVVAVLTVGSAVAAGVHVVRVGDAGSKAVWDGVQNTQPR